jgi:hypothetical protein
MFAVGHPRDWESETGRAIWSKTGVVKVSARAHARVCVRLCAQIGIRDVIACEKVKKTGS